MGQITKEQQIVFGVATGPQVKEPYLVLGVSDEAWQYMQDGKTHTLDLAKIGLPIKLMLFGAPTHQDCVNLITLGMQAAGVAYQDKRDTDFSIDPDGGPEIKP